MAKRHTFQSAIPAEECAVRLQRMTAQSTYEVSLRGISIRLVIGRLNLKLLGDGAYTFRLKARGREQGRHNLPGITALVTARGRLEPLEQGADVTLTARPGSPSTTRGWLLQLAWHAVLLAVFAALVVSAWLSSEAWLWWVAGAFALLVAAHYARLALLHERIVRALYILVERALATGQLDPAATVRLI